jgi:LmbE family N-acetylglucosaminyl deacetylase
VQTLVLCGDGTGIDGKRQVAAADAASILGSELPRFGGFPENRSDTVPLGRIVDVIEREISELSPAIVYVSHGGNLNIDHQTAFRAAATALRPMPGNPVTGFYAYEIASSTDWAPPGFGEAFRPNHFVEITAMMERKRRALQAYAFDMRDEPHARSIVAVENLARGRGATVGMAAAEAFVTLRQLRRA